MRTGTGRRFGSGGSGAQSPDWDAAPVTSGGPDRFPNLAVGTDGRLAAVWTRGEEESHELQFASLE